PGRSRRACALRGFRRLRIRPMTRSVIVMASALDRRARTAGAWCDSQKLLAAINLGMFLDDHLSSVGYARNGEHLNQPRWVAQYQSALAFGARRPGLLAATMVDLDTPRARTRLADYDTVIQSLRLIRGPGRNVGSRQGRRWSEASGAIDRAGRVL